MEKLITVVVPVYKVEPYIDKCLRSLIVPEEQLPLLEVLVVNDGTPDRSADMAREYEKTYPDVFRVIDKENGGHGSAWNRGLKEAKGKYLRFLDSDDWFTTSEFSRLIDRLKTLDVDLVISHYNRYYAETDETIKHPMYLGEETDQTFSADRFDWTKLSWESTNFWGCTYKTEMMQKEQPLFMEKVFYDDAILYMMPVVRSQTIHIFDAIVYNYLLGRPGQTMDPAMRKKHMVFWAKTHFQVFEYYSHHYSEITNKGASDFSDNLVRKWLHDCITRFSMLPYKDYVSLTEEWDHHFNSLEGICPNLSASSHSIHAYRRLPRPLYYLYRKMLSLFFKPQQ